MSANVLVNSLNELWKKIRCEDFLSVYPKEFNQFNNSGARMQDFIYHMTLILHFNSEFRTKRSRFRL